jgi:hypothetical protein
MLIVVELCVHILTPAFLETPPNNKKNIIWVRPIQTQLPYYSIAIARMCYTQILSGIQYLTVIEFKMWNWISTTSKITITVNKA